MVMVRKTAFGSRPWAKKSNAPATARRFFYNLRRFFGAAGRGARDVFDSIMRPFRRVETKRKRRQRKKKRKKSF